MQLGIMEASDSAEMQITNATFDWLPDDDALQIAQVHVEAPCASVQPPRVGGRSETPVASQSSIVGEHCKRAQHPYACFALESGMTKQTT